MVDVLVNGDKDSDDSWCDDDIDDPTYCCDNDGKSSSEDSDSMNVSHVNRRKGREKHFFSCTSVF